MKPDTLRSHLSKLSTVFLAAAALVLGSCGGGGASSSPETSGELDIQPQSGPFYAGVAYTLNIVGGRKPYLVTSNEPTLINLNVTTDSNQVAFVANNPGVVDAGLDPNEVPRRTVTITVRDSVGVTRNRSYQVLQNFFTGYGMGMSGICTGGTSTPNACSGAESIVTLIPVSNGLLYANRDFQFDRVRGDWQFVVEDPNAVPQLVDRLRARTDSTGRAFARLRVTVNAPTQFGSFNVTDVATGATRNMVFNIVQLPSADAITFLPGNSWNFLGPDNLTCGGGSADFFVYGGTPPYSAVATNPVSATPAILTTQGARLTVTMPVGGTICQSGLGVVVTDSKGSRGQITINSQIGTATPPALAVAPTAIASLGCGITSQVSVVGGNGFYSVTSSHPRITATAAGNTISVTRLTGDTVAYPTTGTVAISDGRTLVSLNITATPATCP